jgi:hypothetical protein
MNHTNAVIKRHILIVSLLNNTLLIQFTVELPASDGRARIADVVIEATAKTIAVVVNIVRVLLVLLFHHEIIEGI